MRNLRNLFIALKKWQLPAEGFSCQTGSRQSSTLPISGTSNAYIIFLHAVCSILKRLAITNFYQNFNKLKSLCQSKLNFLAHKNLYIILCKFVSKSVSPSIAIITLLRAYCSLERLFRQICVVLCDILFHQDPQGYRLFLNVENALRSRRFLLFLWFLLSEKRKMHFRERMGILFSVYSSFKFQLMISFLPQKTSHHQGKVSSSTLIRWILTDLWFSLGKIIIYISFLFSKFPVLCLVRTPIRPPVRLL